MLDARALFAVLATSTLALAQMPGERGGVGLALVAEKILTCAENDAPVVDHGVILIRDGKIQVVGGRNEVPIPVGYVVRDCGKNWLAPGLIDLHCHVGGPDLYRQNDINDLVYVTQPELRVAPAVIPENPRLEAAVAGGVTTVLYIPGSGSNSGGQGILLKTAFPHFEEMRIRDPGSLKVAQWGNPESWAIGVGKTFENWHLRHMFRQGLAYAKRWQDYEAGKGARPMRDIQFEVFRDLLAKRTQISTHTQVFQVVLMTITMIRIEFGLDVYIDHGEWAGYLTAPLAMANGVQAIVGPREIETPIGRFFDTDGQIQGIAAEYQKRGHTMIGFNTDSPIVPEHEYQLQAAVACRYGFDGSDMQAVRGLTIIPAKTAGIADRVGSLEPGKDADVLVLAGDPVDPRSGVDQVFIEGRLVYDAARDSRRW